jgi:DNA-binding transcriptional MerR regulator
VSDRPRLRIGELSRRVGESPELLRAWESRYGLVEPERTTGGLRLYSEQDESRIRAMRRHIRAGLSAAEAARQAKLENETPPSARPPELADLAAKLQHSFDRLDEEGAQRVLDDLLQNFGVREALGGAILPFLSRLGERWALGEARVAQEHFASHVVGARLRGLARGWGDGVGPVAVLACVPGELHDLGLLSFGLLLRERGWRITYLGPDTPLEEVEFARREVEPQIVVLAATRPAAFLDSGGLIQELAAGTRVGIGGAGASAELATRLGVESLAGDVIEVAAALRP